MNFEQRTRYMGIAVVIVLLLIVLEVTFMSTLLSPPNVFTPLVTPVWRTLYTIVIALLSLGIAGIIVWIWYMVKHPHQTSTYGTAHFASKQELYQGAVTKPPATGQGRRFHLKLPVRIPRILFIIVTAPLMLLIIAWLWGTLIAIGLIGPSLLFVIVASSMFSYEAPEMRISHENMHIVSPQKVESIASPSEFTLGNAHGTPIFLSEEQLEGHVLIVAPTRRGKTAGVIIPNLLAENGSRSLLINDVKHELIDKCIRAVARYHDCFILAPTRPAESNRYNPLAHVKAESLSDARNVAECIVRNTGNAKEPFWDNSARLLLTSAILHLRVTEPEAAFSCLADICTMNIAELSELITNSPSLLAQRVGTSFVKNVAAEQRLQSNVMTDIATRLFDVLDPQIEEVTASDELDFQQISEKPSALFLHIPPHEATRLRWLSSCLIMQLINHLFEQPHKQRFAFYLDELANAGYIPNYLEYISYIRSAGIAFLQVIQDFGQLERIYEEHGKETLLANSGTKVFLSGVGQVEAEYASRVMGDTTVRARSENNQEDKITYSETARKLMNPDEIRSLPLGAVLVLIGNMPPIIAHHTPYFQVPEALALVNLPYIPPIRVRPLPGELPTHITPSLSEESPEPLNKGISPSGMAREFPLLKQTVKSRDDDAYFTDVNMSE